MVIAGEYTGKGISVWIISLVLTVLICNLLNDS